MSALKYQLKELVASQSLEANKVKDPAVKRRLYLIKAVAESKKDVKKTCEMRGVSTDYFYKWGRRFVEAGGLKGLGSRPKTPKAFWNQTPHRVEKRIARIRKAEPFKGPERISYDLKKRFNIFCAPSTVAAVLKRRGLVTQKYREQLTKKHMKRYRRPWPGFLQMDFKYTPYLIEGKQYYQLSVVDHHSSWRFIRAYRDRTTETVLCFLNELQSEIPFPIMQIQTDNASEFTDKFSSQKGLRATETHALDIWCRHREIEHKLIPVGEKELNGKVENTHRYDDREFFSQIDVRTFEELAHTTREYNHRWNELRPTKTLGWLTPSETVYQAYVRALAYLQLLLPKSAWAKQKSLKTIKVGLGHITVPWGEVKKIKNVLHPKKPKKLSAVDRYLAYMDWEAKNKLKSWLSVPMILQNFSTPDSRHAVSMRMPSSDRSMFQ